MSEPFAMPPIIGGVQRSQSSKYELWISGTYTSHAGVFGTLEEIEAIIVSMREDLERYKADALRAASPSAPPAAPHAVEATDHEGS